MGAREAAAEVACGLRVGWPSADLGLVGVETSDGVEDIDREVDGVEVPDRRGCEVGDTIADLHIAFTSPVHIF